MRWALGLASRYSTHGHGDGTAADYCDHFKPSRLLDRHLHLPTTGVERWRYAKRSSSKAKTAPRRIFKEAGVSFEGMVTKISNAAKSAGLAFAAKQIFDLGAHTIKMAVSAGGAAGAFQAAWGIRLLHRGCHGSRIIPCSMLP